MLPKIKTFDELTTRELYEILRSRAEIFVVEQDCVYQDLDCRITTAGTFSARTMTAE